MSTLNWLLLLLVFTGYLLIGGVTFMKFEGSVEEEQRLQVQNIREQLYEQFLSPASGCIASLEERHALVGELGDSCGQDFFNCTKCGPLRWNMYNSFFFAFTIVTTIGYGNISPSSKASKIFCIFYALLGIPLNGIVLAAIADFFMERVRRNQEKWKNKGVDSTTKAALIVNLTYYLIPLFLLFILLPAGIFVALEHWTFLDAIYYAFISLTTIGFGDFVAGMEYGSNWLWVYKVVLIIWILFGLGYLIMIIGFITNALQSKRVRKVAKGIRATTKRLAAPAKSKQIRRLLNELYIMQVQPVYRERSSMCHAPIGHSFSQPNNLDKAADNIDPKKKISQSHPAIHRTHSDSDLDHIDRQATFATGDAVSAACNRNHNSRDLMLGRLVVALGGFAKDMNEMIPEGSETDSMVQQTRKGSLNVDPEKGYVNTERRNTIGYGELPCSRRLSFPLIAGFTNFTFESETPEIQKPPERQRKLSPNPLPRIRNSVDYAHMLEKTTIAEFLHAIEDFQEEPEDDPEPESDPETPKPERRQSTSGVKKLNIKTPMRKISDGVAELKMRGERIRRHGIRVPRVPSMELPAPGLIPEDVITAHESEMRRRISKESSDD